MFIVTCVCVLIEQVLFECSFCEQTYWHGWLFVFVCVCLRMFMFCVGIGRGMHRGPNVMFVSLIILFDIVFIG